MQLIKFIVSRLYKVGNKTESLSSPVVKICIVGVALGMAVMLVAISVVVGFKKEIQEKITGFTAHIHLVNYDLNATYDSNPINADRDFMQNIQALPEVKHMQKFATKPGIVRTSTDLQAIVLKGMNSDFDTTFFSECLIAGHLPVISDSLLSNQVIISEIISNKLKINIGDKLPTYFMQNPVRVRNFTVSGIYSTNLEMYDEIYVLCDIRHIQRLNGWKENEVSGYEIFIRDINKLNEVTDQIINLTALSFDEKQAALRAVPVTELNPQIFDWLELQNINVYVIIILMILVSATNMVTGLLILILERTQFIGILKTLGTNNKTLQKIFVVRSAQIVLQGIAIGNLIGLAIILIQHFWHPLRLDPASYYLTHVPVFISPFYWVLINVITFLCLILLMTIPAKYVSRITVAKIMRFD